MTALDYVRHPTVLENLNLEEKIPNNSEIHGLRRSKKAQTAAGSGSPSNGRAEAGFRAEFADEKHR